MAKEANLVLHYQKRNKMEKKEISYENATNEIEEILAKLENDELNVDELTSNIQRVSKLLKLCKTKLHSTEKQIESILKEIDEE